LAYHSLDDDHSRAGKAAVRVTEKGA